MKDYFLPFPKANSPFSIHHQSSILSVGSCFAEEVGYHLFSNCFNITINPYGIVFSPKMIVKQLQEIIERKVYGHSDLILSNDLYFSYMHHSAFSGLDPYQVVTSINNEISEAHDLLKQKGATLVLTFGSAYYYELVESNKAVANCHKQPNHLFNKVLQSSNEMITEWELLMKTLLLFNPSIKLILTVSPVRYIRDGMIENNISKAQLFSLMQFLKSQSAVQSTYFPAFEIVNDCLRDYRFFKEDMVHPNKLAVNEVWNYFQSVFFNESTQQMTNQITEFNKQVKHSLLHNESKAARLFDEKTKRSREIFFNTHPYLQKSKYYQDYFSVYSE
jgi:GSCFA family